jgi:hypothetical protein
LFEPFEAARSVVELKFCPPFHVVFFSGFFSTSNHLKSLKNEPELYPVPREQYLSLLNTSEQQDLE